MCGTGSLSGETYVSLSVESTLSTRKKRSADSSKMKLHEWKFVLQAIGLLHWTGGFLLRCNRIPICEGPCTSCSFWLSILSIPTPIVQGRTLHIGFLKFFSELGYGPYENADNSMFFLFRKVFTNRRISFSFEEVTFIHVERFSFCSNDNLEHRMVALWSRTGILSIFRMTFPYIVSK